MLEGTPSTMGIESSKTSKIVDELSSSRMSKVNSSGLLEIEGVLIAALETERRDSTSRFMYLFWLLNEAQSPCWPQSSTGIPALKAAEAEPIRPDWEPYWPLNSFGVRPSIPPNQTKGKVAHILCVFNR